MKSKEKKPLKVKFYPLTPERWADFEKLFGPRGACGGCWCMWWRMKRSEFMKQKGEGNRRALKRIVDSGEIPGLLAYFGEEPVGWIAVAPREVFAPLGRSRVLAPIDGEKVWSVVCFFVAKEFRHQGVTTGLLRAAVEHVQKQGGKIVEGYPVEPNKPQPDPFVFTGLVSTFRKVGFTEAARRSPTRPVMRYVIGET
jgi:GNAT superfamily N-acetyltransferase